MIPPLSTQTSRINTIQSGDIVTVVLVHEDLGQLDRVYIAGAYARRGFAEKQATAVKAAKPDATINLVDTFLDTQAGFYPGFGINPRER